MSKPTCLRALRACLCLCLALLAPTVNAERESGDGDSFTGSCEKCGDDRECLQQCYAQFYAHSYHRAERHAHMQHLLERQELQHSILHNPDYTEPAKSTLLDQLLDDFEAFAIPQDVTLGQELIPAKEVILSRVSANYYVPDLGGLSHCGSECVLERLADIPTTSITLTYALQSLSAVEVDQHINGEAGKSLEFRLDGNALAQSPPDASFPAPGEFRAWTFACPELSLTGDCMRLSVHGSTWFPGQQPPWPDNWLTELRLKAGPGNSDNTESARWVYPPRALRSFWLYTIGKTVTHERCTTCHTMDQPAKIAVRHAAGGINLPDSVHELIPSALVPGMFVNGCQNCHTGGTDPGTLTEYLGEPLPGDGFDEGRWATPTPAQDINWAQFVNDFPQSWPSVICQRMTSLTPHQLEEHFHEDFRLFWAVASGIPPNQQQLPTAPPNAHPSFVLRFDKWLAAGMPCPQ